MISDLRRTTFDVAWKIQRIMYSPGFWVCMEDWLAEIIKHPGKGHELMENCILRSDSAKPEIRRNCEPKITRHDNLGRIFSREGLAVIFFDGFPSWMETPWGEWWCWERPDAGLGPRNRYSSTNCQERFLEKVLIEEPNNPSQHHYRIRQFESIPLPRQEGIGINQLPQEEIAARQAEWITLCQEMNPPRFPHWYLYIEAGVDIPVNHPDYEYAQKQLSTYRGQSLQSWSPLSVYALKHPPAS
jgi:hypothetical protein